MMFALPRSLAIASLSKACSLRVGARPSMPTTMLAFGPLMYVFNKLMVPSFSGSGTVIGEMSPRDGECRGCGLLLVGWLVGCLGFNGPLRQYFSLYQAVSQREGERREKG